MLRLAIIFFIISIVAGFFGFGGISSTTADMALFLFWIFFIISVVTLIFGFLGSKKI
jgi:uncharacterized membrane protein YtjA (UPF0391 family)